MQPQPVGDPATAREAHVQALQRLYTKLLLAQPGCASPAWFDPSGLAVLDPMRAAVDAIVEEGRQVLRRFENLHAGWPARFRTANPGIVGSRASFYLRLGGLPVRRNRELCPRTAAVLDGMPDVTNAAFYVLGPRGHILPHRGICDGLLRAHLGVVCPEGATLTVKGEPRAWQEGQFLVFDDRHEHEARNDSDSWRCILLFDLVSDPGLSGAERAVLAAQQRLQILKRIDLEGHFLAGLEGDEGLSRALRAAAESMQRTRPEPWAELRAIVDENGFYSL